MGPHVGAPVVALGPSNPDLGTIDLDRDVLGFQEVDRGKGFLALTHRQAMAHLDRFAFGGDELAEEETIFRFDSD